jgi:hypothetical protein
MIFEFIGEFPPKPLTSNLLPLGAGTPSATRSSRTHFRARTTLGHISRGARANSVRGMRKQDDECQANNLAKKVLLEWAKLIQGSR